MIILLLLASLLKSQNSELPSSSQNSEIQPPLGQSYQVSPNSEPQSSSQNHEPQLSLSIAQPNRLLEGCLRSVRHPYPKYFNDNKFVNLSTVFPISTALEASDVRQALQDVRWKKAMEEEFVALVRNGTWELMPHNGHAPVGCKWVYRVKGKIDGMVDRFKARLEAKGFLPELRRDYFEMFSLVIKPVTILVI